MSSLIISLGVFKGSGGPTKTISSFKKALCAEQFSFCSREELDAGPLAVDGAEAVVASSLPILKQLRVAGGSKTADAEFAFSQSQIVSCHSYYRYHALWVNKNSRKYKVPYWFVPHGILDPWVMQNGQVAKRLYWACGGARFLEQASTVIFSTSAERDKAMSQFDLPAAEVIYWPVELVERTNFEARRARIREELGISEDARVLLYFGRIHSMKKPLETIRSVANVGDESLHLVMVGNEQDVSLKDCYAVADQCGISSRVHLVGPVYNETKFDYMMAADAYISLSYRENFNHTAAESLSAGLPVILSPGNDLQVDIRDEMCSWGLKDERLETASQVIEEFSQMPLDKLQSMGVRGREWVEENLQFSTFAQRLRLAAETYGRSL